MAERIGPGTCAASATSTVVDGAGALPDLFPPVHPAMATTSASAANQTSITGPKNLPTAAVPLRWTAGHHFANDSVSAFSVVVNAGSFANWRYEQTGWIADPWVGLDAPKR